MDTAGEGEGGVNSREALDIYITICKTDGQWEAMHNIGNSTYGHSVTTWRGGMGVGGRLKREGTYVYLWLIHTVVWQKPA